MVTCKFPLQNMPSRRGALQVKQGQGVERERQPLFGAWPGRKSHSLSLIVMHSHRQPTINVQYVACDIGCLVRGKELDCCRHVGCLAHLTEGNRAEQLFLGLL